MIIDIIFVLVIILAIYKGYNRGLIIALCSVLAWLLGLAAALKLSAVTANYFQQRYHINSYWLPIVVFILLFLVVIVIVRFIGKLLEKVIQLALLGWLNRLLGVIFYFFIYLVIFSILLWLADQVYLISPSVKTASRIYPYIHPLGPYVIDKMGWLIPYFKNIFSDLENFFAEIASHIHQ